MPTKIQGGLGIDKVQDGTVGMSSTDTELYGKITALTTINLGEAKTATGTVVDFDVPLGVKRVTVMFGGVSTNGTSPIQIQLGSFSGFITSGYGGGVSNQAGTCTTNSGGLAITNTGATGDSHTGKIDIVSSALIPFHFVSTGLLFSNGTSARYSAGARYLDADLDRIRITTVNGTDQFDNGTINISWEF